MAKKKAKAKVVVKPGRGGARKGAGRKKFAEGKSKANPQVQFGRRPQSDIDLIDQAASLAGVDRAAWVWPILIRESEQQIAKGR